MNKIPAGGRHWFDSDAATIYTDIDGNWVLALTKAEKWYYCDPETGFSWRPAKFREVRPILKYLKARRKSPSPTRSLRIDDTLWTGAQKAAKTSGVSVNQIVQEALQPQNLNEIIARLKLRKLRSQSR